MLSFFVIAGGDIFLFRRYYISIMVLTGVQIAEFGEVFKLLDKDGDGLVAVDEIESILRIVQQPDKTSDQLINKMSGQLIDFQTFLAILTYTVVDNEESILDSFRTFDYDNSGFISVNLFRHIITVFGHGITDNEIDEMIQIADTNETGKIDYTYFVKMVLQQ